jgi:hypothetical protein
LPAAGAFAAGFLPVVRRAAQADRAVAREFIEIDGWLDTAAPLTPAGLRGKVVLVNFWTYSRINCRRTVPIPQPLFRLYDRVLSASAGKKQMQQLNSSKGRS